MKQKNREKFPVFSLLMYLYKATYEFDITLKDYGKQVRLDP